jgi:hypothetical protein
MALDSDVSKGGLVCSTVSLACPVAAEKISDGQYSAGIKVALVHYFSRKINFA